MLKQDFLSDTLGAMLFPDLLQRFLPLPLFNDRAIALDQSFERAWAGAHPEDPTRFKESFHELWRKAPYRVPLLFFNSTVVETGQRAINTPIATMTQDADPAFTDTLSVGRLIGTELPLSTAALLSARFTYVSPAALIDTHGQHDPNWIRLVDGGYFDNSGAVTAQEIARVLVDSHLVCGAGDPVPDMPCMRLIVLHLPNEPQPPTAVLNEKKKNTGGIELMSEVFGPVAPVIRFSTADEAAKLAADTEYGLSLGILTGDPLRGLDLARKIPTGIVHINDQTVDDAPNTPFGGVFASGTGARFGGTANLDAFTDTRWVTMRADIAPYPF